MKTIGAVLGSVFALLLVFNFYHDAHPPAPQSPTKPIDTAFGLCKQWTETNSKLVVGEFIWVDEITDAKLPPHHHMLEYDYRSKGEGLLMQTRCEYLEDGSLVSERSSRK